MKSTSSKSEGAWVNDENAALLTDLYELTMLQSYWKEGLQEPAVFSLYVRSLPESRNYLVACGLHDALRYLSQLRFHSPELAYLASLQLFSPAFLDWLKDFRFRGDVYAMPEGTPFFAEEPLLEVEASLPEAQLIESFLLNQIHFQTLAASKAVRVVEAAGPCPVIDFGFRRMHGTDAALKAARAFYIAGVSATSNVLAGQIYGIPVAGTMAHSFIQAHQDETEAFRAFAQLYPQTVLLVDTYDTLAAVHKVVALATELGDKFTIQAIRLDSGELAELARQARKILDRAQLQNVEIFASGGLDEHEIRELRRLDAPINGFGVGTSMGVSSDAPALEMVYKMTSYAGSGRIKLSPGKRILPGRKQVFREYGAGGMTGDTIARADEILPGEPLLTKVMEAGRCLSGTQPLLQEIRQFTAVQRAGLPEAMRAIGSKRAYAVTISSMLERYTQDVMRRTPNSP